MKTYELQDINRKSLGTVKYKNWSEVIDVVSQYNDNQIFAHERGIINYKTLNKTIIFFIKGDKQTFPLFMCKTFKKDLKNF